MTHLNLDRYLNLKIMYFRSLTEDSGKESLFLYLKVLISLGGAGSTGEKDVIAMIWRLETSSHKLFY